MGRMILPTVRNLKEAAHLNHRFPAVVTAGPTFREVNWKHQNHHVEVFHDTIFGAGAPSITSVKRILEFTKSNRGKILVHCHAGISRSTSTAIGIALQRGFSAEEAVFGLLEIHPTGRPFAPNERIMEILANLFDMPELPELADEAFTTGWAVENGIIVPKSETTTPVEQRIDTENDDDDEWDPSWDSFDPWAEDNKVDDYSGKVLYD